MANEKETKKMADQKHEVAGEAVKPLVLKVTDLKPKQKVLNLETNEDAEIEVISQRFELPKYDAAVHGTRADFARSAMLAASALVQPVEQQIDALLYRATQNSYQAGKATALASGNFLTQDLRTNIVQIMKGNNAYADFSASECFNKWKAGFAEKKPGAIKVLTMAQDMGSVEEF